MLLRLEEYDIYLRSGKASENTRLSYKTDLEILEKWLADRISADGLFDISSVILEEYVEYLNASGRSSSTVSRSVTSLRKYFSWAYMKGYVFNDPSRTITAPKVIKKKPVAADAFDILRLLNAIDTKNARGMRDMAIMRLMISTGISTAELLDLKLGDVDSEKRLLYAGEGRRRRELKPDRKAFGALKKYISRGRAQLVTNLTEKPDLNNTGRRKSPEEGFLSEDGLLFLNAGGKRLTRQGLWKNIKGYAKDAGIKGKITPEAIRHSFALNALKSGEDSEAVRKKLGHVTNSSVLEYASML